MHRVNYIQNLPLPETSLAFHRSLNFVTTFRHNSYAARKYTRLTCTCVLFITDETGIRFNSCEELKYKIIFSVILIVAQRTHFNNPQTSVFTSFTTTIFYYHYYYSGVLILQQLLPINAFGQSRRVNYFFFSLGNELQTRLFHLRSFINANGIVLLYNHNLC